MLLREMLAIKADDCVAFTGAGGKSTAIFYLAREFASPVFITTTTHLGTWQAAEADRHIDLSREALPSAGQLQGVMLVTAPSEVPQRLGAPEKGQLNSLREIAARSGVPLLIEADGAKGRPLKAPADYEPVVPDFVTVLVVCAGMSALGQPLNDAIVHRVERFASLSGLRMGEGISVEALARVLAHPLGGLKGLPSNTQARLLLNQVEDDRTLLAAQRLATNLCEVYGHIALANLRTAKLFS